MDLKPPNAIYVSFVDRPYGTHIQKWGYERFEDAIKYTRVPLIPEDRVVEALIDALEVARGEVAKHHISRSALPQIDAALANARSALGKENRGGDDE